MKVTQVCLAAGVAASLLFGAAGGAEAGWREKVLAAKQNPVAFAEVSEMCAVMEAWDWDVRKWRWPETYDAAAVRVACLKVKRMRKKCVKRAWKFPACNDVAFTPPAK